MSGQVKQNLVNCNASARRGWANGLCISCARCNRYMEPRKSRNRCHHKKEMPSEKEPKEKKPKVKKEPKEKKPNHYPKDSVASRHQDRDNMSEGLNANWKDYYPDLIEEEGSGWPPSVNRRLNVRAPQKKSMVVMPRGKNSKPNAQAHHVRAENEGVIEKAEDAGGKRWSKEVVIVRKLPPITQPTMERKGQRRMMQRRLGRNIHDVPDDVDRIQFAMELAALPIETVMKM